MIGADTAPRWTSQGGSVPGLGVAFRGRAVVVRSAAPAVLARLAERFGDLAAASASDPVGCIEIGGDGDGYHLSIDDEASVRGGTLDDVVRCAEYHVVGRLIAATPELLWLHAAAAARHGRAVLCVGPSGCGKSTLATGLCARGYHYLADDTVPIDPASGLALPFPRAPLVRRPVAEYLPPEQLSTLVKTARCLASSAVHREPVPVEAVIFPAYAPHATSALLRCSPATAALQVLGQCLNIAHQREAALQFLCALAETVPSFRLTYRNGEAAANQVARAHSLGWREAALGR